ncbi:DUF4199 domain-containing protein [Pedobacter aquatilis]|uniref:DUF4199 domain-containing protein n=1 Tax=Pedobacter aquatilis TaxID=351343 RepID=UPI0025B32F6B|nr:DUF4199 domain-containing protein [Pedobacter aquatilis]MDN3588445.1 DUF4199 domain-containing protein [Pedobacter aquatilis]
MEQQIIEEEKKPNALAFKVAISFAIYSIAIMFILKLIGIDSTNPELPISEKIIAMVLSYGVFIVAIFYAQITHKKELGGYITYGRAFSTGFKVAAYAGLFVGLLFVLYYKVLDPTALDKIADVAIEQANGDEQKIKGIEMMRGYMWIFTAFGAAIAYTLLGLLESLVTSAIIKKERG